MNQIVVSILLFVNKHLSKMINNNLFPKYESKPILKNYSAQIIEV